MGLRGRGGWNAVNRSTTATAFDTSDNRGVEKVVKTFSSLAEADAGDAQAYAHLTPAERLKILIELRERHTLIPLNEDLREFIELSNSNQVEYLVVGSFAVAYRGFPRYTGDLDILVGQAERMRSECWRPSGNSG